MTIYAKHTSSNPTEKLLLSLRDGRKLLGVLRSWDQFANLVLTDTKERYFCVADPTTQPRRLYCDVPRGTYLVRGENVLLIGEVDLDRDDDPPPGYEEGEPAEVFKWQKEVEVARKAKDKSRTRKAAAVWGGELEGSGEVLF
jgi:U6 snRNA-associated Sm-like protein LSm1